MHLLARQVAEALAGRGAVRASVSLLAALAQDALLEGWLSLAAGLLYRLLEVSAPLETVRALLAFHHRSPAGGCLPVELRHPMQRCNHVWPLHNIYCNLTKPMFLELLDVLLHMERHTPAAHPGGNVAGSSDHHDNKGQHSF